MKKLVSFLVSMMMILSLCIPVLAINGNVDYLAHEELLITNSPGQVLDSPELEEINLIGFTELSVIRAVSDYFNTRKSYLLGYSDIMDWDVIGIVTDESNHKKSYVISGIIPTNIEYNITETNCYDRESQLCIFKLYY